MYSIRVYLDENSFHGPLLEGTPKQVVSKLCESISSRKNLTYRISEIMYRLARISYETYNISHFDKSLMIIAAEIQSRFLEENIIQFKVIEENKFPSINNNLRYFQNLLTKHDNDKTLSFEQLRYQKKQQEMIFAYMSFNNKIFEKDFKNFFRLFDNVFRMVINFVKMRIDINKFCIYLKYIETQCLLINRNIWVHPVSLSNDRMSISNDYIDKYLSKKKVLLLDSNQMLETLIELNLEYQKNSLDSTLYFGVRKSDQKLTRLLSVDKVAYYNKASQETKRSPQGILFDVLAKIEFGMEGDDKFIIPKKNTRDDGRICRTVSFLAGIIYDYQEYIKQPISQRCLCINIYIIEEEKLKKYFPSGIFDINKLQINDNKDFKKVKGRICRDFWSLAQGLEFEKMSYENITRKEICKTIQEYYPEYLKFINLPDYTHLDDFYKKVVKKLLNT